MRLLQTRRAAVDLPYPFNQYHHGRKFNAHLSIEFWKLTKQ